MAKISNLKNRLYLITVCLLLYGLDLVLTGQVTSISNQTSYENLSLSGFFRLAERNRLLKEKIESFKKAQTPDELAQLRQSTIQTLHHLEIGLLSKAVLKVSNISMRFFKGRTEIDVYFTNYRRLQKITRIIDDLGEKPDSEFVFKLLKRIDGSEKSTAHLIKSLKTQKKLQLLQRFLNKLKSNEENSVDLVEEFNHFPQSVKEILKNSVHLVFNGDETPNFKKKIQHNPQIFLRIINSHQESILEQLIHHFGRKLQLHYDLALLHDFHASNNGSFSFSELSAYTQEKLVDKQFDFHNLTVEKNLSVIAEVINNLEKHKEVRNHTILRRLHRSKIYSRFKPQIVSADTLKQYYPEEALNQPIRVTMVAVEYTGLLKQGGLAEAVYGMIKGLQSQNKHNQLRLIFPKYDLLPAEIISRLKLTNYQISAPEDPTRIFRVFEAKLDGIQCYFIDDSQEDLFAIKKHSIEGKIGIYGPTEFAAKSRFAHFSSAAAELIYQLKDQTDIIHLHDWHTAGIAIYLSEKYKQDWLSGSIPPIVFTFHNNNQSAQGIYDYRPTADAYRRIFIGQPPVNLFVEALKRADFVTTVSETFAFEAQTKEFGEGIATDVLHAALQDKFVGIINGSNPSRWNPQKDTQLKNWTDPETNEHIDLTYDLRDNIVSRKSIVKQQLQKWLKKYLPKVEFDFNKALVTFIGRYDSHQKGLDRLEPAIQAALDNGAQFILMGSQEDSEATRMLDELEKKYQRGVLFIRDYRGEDGKFIFQEGSNGVSGIGSLIRAASDLVYIPSRFEPCGLVQFESWLFGSPVVGAKTGGLADTIKEQDDPHFNGFLFDPIKVAPFKAAYQAVENALKTLYSWDEDQLNHLMRRLIQEGRQYSWTTSPYGLSPIDKYRIVYEHAKMRVKLRSPDYYFLDLTRPIVLAKETPIWQRYLSKFYQILLKHFPSLRYVSLPFENEKIKQIHIQAYQELYNRLDTDNWQLDKIYRSFSTEIRSEIDTPYGKNVQYKQYTIFGSHPSSEGVYFHVFAPAAKEVLVCLFNDEEELEKRFTLSKAQDGSWSILVPSIKVGQRYQYLIDGKVKIDPYGLSQKFSRNWESPPYSVVVDRNAYQWHDAEWLSNRRLMKNKSRPINIYEVHPAFWQRKEGQPLNYKDLAHQLGEYCLQNRYSHVELMGILEHPADESMGYQVTGFFAPNSRLGTVDDFKYFVDYLHRLNIGVILDWIPDHFALDEYSLNQFDGTDLFQPSLPDLCLSYRQYLFRWGAKFFDFRKKVVRDFLFSSAFYWVEQMHIDGLRVDAVSAILYSEDSFAGKLFLKDLNFLVHRQYPGVLTIAEDYSQDSLTTDPIDKGGLGFDLRWNIGWTSQTMDYFSRPIASRKKHYSTIAKASLSHIGQSGLLYISHDEIDHGKKPIIDKIPNLSVDEQYANQRLVYSYMMSMPGKKLSFMGTEFASRDEMKDIVLRKALSWDNYHTLQAQQLQTMVRTINYLYLHNWAFWEKDKSPLDVEWIEKKDKLKGLIAYRRRSSNGQKLAFIHNFSTEDRQYEVKLPSYFGLIKNSIQPREIFNSDSLAFGGKGKINIGISLILDENERSISYTVRIPAFSTVIIEEQAPLQH